MEASNYSPPSLALSLSLGKELPGERKDTASCLMPGKVPLEFRGGLSELLHRQPCQGV